MTRPAPLNAYVGLVVASAVPVLLWVLLSTQWNGVLDDPVVLLVLSATLILGELRPIMISHGDDSVDLVTISSCFSLALVLEVPLAVALAVQFVALAADDVRARRTSVLKISFNLANFVLSLVLFRLVYCALSGRAVLDDDRAFSSGDVVPSLLAALVFYVVNQTLTTVVIAIATEESIVPNLRRDLRSHAATMGVLLALAPVVVHAVTFAPLLVLVLLMPIAAVHKSARLAVERERQALHDSLTGLPNRVLFHERTTKALRLRSTDQVAVMLLDLDHFKEINDTLGHHVGDLLLVEVAARIRATVREQDVVARLGGDEFALLCPALPDDASAEELADRVVHAMEETFSVGGVRLDVRATVGFSLAPEHGTDAQTLLQRADIALYEAKQQRGTWSRYVAERDEHSREKLALLGELRAGLRRGELRVHYQPLCDAQTGALLSVEALVRWQHPARGLLAPSAFIHIAENTGMIAALTRVVLRECLDQLVAWDALGLRIDAAVNLSARQLSDVDLPQEVADLLAERGLQPDRLVLELTESHFVADAGRAEAVLRRLRDLGVRLAVDDFGTGYSSLTQLRSLTVDVLKIDRSFVMNMAKDENDALIVRSTIDLGHNLGLRVVAEGVEDQAAWDTLAALGCDVVQGYHLSRPLPADDLFAWARAHLPPQQALACVSPSGGIPC